MRRKLRRAERKLTPLKAVTVKGSGDEWEICLPDWKKVGSYHLHIKGRRWEEIRALKECIEEIENVQ